tara:strand:- start:76102 stop:76812 length:711 start_codon:yes stop_codon:yes gene_type:complete
MKLKKNYRNILAIFVALSSSLLVLSEIRPIKGSIAILDSNFGDMTVEMRNQGDSWLLKSSLEGGRLISRKESEIIKIKNHQIIPISYNFEQRILFNKYKSSAKFDWQKNKVSYTEKSDIGQLDLIAGVLGPSSAQLQLRLDFRRFKPNEVPNNISYTVYWKGNIKKRVFQVLGKEEIDTPLGVYKAYKVARIYPDGEDKKQVFWLAPSLDFAVIRILSFDGKREADIKIKSIEEID